MKTPFVLTSLLAGSLLLTSAALAPNPDSVRTPTPERVLGLTSVGFVDGMPMLMSDTNPPVAVVSAGVASDQKVLPEDSYGVAEGRVSEVKPEDIPEAPGYFVNDVTWDIQWPFPVSVKISSGFGPRAAPCGACSSNHRGLDLSVKDGTPIQAIYNGVVTEVGWMGETTGLGQFVRIEHEIDGEDVQTTYGHMIKDSDAVSVGDTVRTGDLLGLVGNTGASTGNHLHFEVAVDGVQTDPHAWLLAHVGNLR